MCIKFNNSKIFGCKCQVVLLAKNRNHIGSSLTRFDSRYIFMFENDIELLAKRTEIANPSSSIWEKGGGEICGISTFSFGLLWETTRSSSTNCQMP